MRDRGDVRDGPDFHAKRLHGADGILATGSGTLDYHIHFLDAHRLGGFDSLLRCKSCSERRALAGALETSRSRTTPCYCIAFRPEPKNFDFS